MNNITIAFLLTFLAGLSTVVGSVIAFGFKKTNKAFLSSSLGFSAGVMIYISFVELLDEAKESLVDHLGATTGEWATVGFFFLGILVIALIDKMIPNHENPHHVWDEKKVEGLSSNKEIDIEDKASLHRTGVKSALALAIHNFPEGLVTFVAAMVDPALGLSIAIAIALHNIPEGIAVSVPIYYSTGSKKKAFGYALFSGLAEPVGALIGYFVFSALLNELFFGFIFSFVAGIMVFISIDELLPTSRKYGEGHKEIYGFVLGMAVMAVSLVLI
ncbi:zinc transporter ZupT [Halonatronum saccharophilum]|uniref:zinc transporter ZupT n=1 Tax=Halonatronum saccharophilum TaxID=150060 RepID=UPI0004857AD3